MSVRSCHLTWPAFVIGIGMVLSAAGFVVLGQVSPSSPVAVTVIGVVAATFGKLGWAGRGRRRAGA